MLAELYGARRQGHPVTAASDNVAALQFQLKALNLPIGETEHRFHPERKWRFDLAWPAIKLALEVDGGSWVGGRHTSGSGFAADCQKMSEAAILGWRIIRVTPVMVRDGLAVRYVERALGATSQPELKIMVDEKRKRCPAPGCLTMIPVDRDRCQFHSSDPDRFVARGKTT